MRLKPNTSFVERTRDRDSPVPPLNQNWSNPTWTQWEISFFAGSAREYDIYCTLFSNVTKKAIRKHCDIFYKTKKINYSKCSNTKWYSTYFHTDQMVQNTMRNCHLVTKSVDNYNFHVLHGIYVKMCRWESHSVAYCCLCWRPLGAENNGSDSAFILCWMRLQSNLQGASIKLLMTTKFTCWVRKTISIFFFNHHIITSVHSKHKHFN